jgi:hypothetical protein
MIHDCFPLLELKVCFWFKNLLLNWPLFIFVRIVFRKLCFFTDILADMAVRYTLCLRYNLCAYCSHLYHNIPFSSYIVSAVYSICPEADFYLYKL